MKTIPFTKEMGVWIKTACQQAGITKAALAEGVGRNSNYYSMTRAQVDEDTWKKTLRFFEKQKSVSGAVKEVTTEPNIFDRFRALAAEPGSSPSHLQSVFGISDTTYHRIIQGHNGSRVLPRMIAAFKKLDGETEKMVKPKKAPVKKTAPRLKTEPQSVASVIKMVTQIRSMLAGVSKEEKREFLELFAD